MNSEGDLYGQTLAAINSGAAGKCGKGEYPAWWTRVNLWKKYDFFKVMLNKMIFFLFRFQVTSNGSHVSKKMP